MDLFPVAVFSQARTDSAVKGGAVFAPFILPFTAPFGCAILRGAAGDRIPLSRFPFQRWKGAGGIGLTMTL
jgi:hypothetical protein